MDCCKTFLNGLVVYFGSYWICLFVKVFGCVGFMRMDFVGLFKVWILERANVSRRFIFIGAHWLNSRTCNLIFISFRLLFESSCDKEVGSKIVFFFIVLKGRIWFEISWHHKRTWLYKGTSLTTSLLFKIYSNVNIHFT